MKKVLHLHFYRSWWVSDLASPSFSKPYLFLGVAQLSVKWERWGVGCCSDSWLHLRATGSKFFAKESDLPDNLLASYFSRVKICLIRLNIGHWPLMLFVILAWILSLNNLTEWGFYFGTSRDVLYFIFPISLLLCLLTLPVRISIIAVFKMQPEEPGLPRDPLRGSSQKQ